MCFLKTHFIESKKCYLHILHKIDCLDKFLLLYPSPSLKLLSKPALSEGLYVCHFEVYSRSPFEKQPGCYKTSENRASQISTQLLIYQGRHTLLHTYCFRTSINNIFIMQLPGEYSPFIEKKCFFAQWSGGLPLPTPLVVRPLKKPRCVSFLSGSYLFRQLISFEFFSLVVQRVPPLSGPTTEKNTYFCICPTLLITNCWTFQKLVLPLQKKIHIVNNIMFPKTFSKKQLTLSFFRSLDSGFNSKSNTPR